MAKAKEKQLGKIIHYYDKIGVGIIQLKAALKIGEEVHVKGNKTDFTQVIGSMQIEHAPVEKAKSKDVIGVKMDQEVREGDGVYKA